MKILIYNPLSMRIDGGGVNWIVEVANGLKKINHEVMVFSIAYDAGQSRLSCEDVRKRLGDIEWYEVPVIKTPFESLGLPMISPRGFVKLVKLSKTVDVVYVIVSHGAEFLFSLIKVLTGKPVVAGILAPLFYGKRLHDIYTYSLRKLALSFFEGHHVLNDFYEQVFRSWSMRNVFMIPSGVDATKFKETVDGNLRNKKFKVLFVGRLAWQKGVGILCKAIERLRIELGTDEIEFRIVGSGPLERMVDEVSERFEGVQALGYISNNQLLQEYSAAHLMVLPSREEGFSLSVLEGCASGIPIVATNIPGLKEVVRDGINGVLVPSDDPASLSDAILRMYRIWKKDFGSYVKLRKASREMVKEFSWDRIAEKTERMLTELVNHNTRILTRSNPKK